MLRCLSVLFWRMAQQDRKHSASPGPLWICEPSTWGQRRRKSSSACVLTQSFGFPLSALCILHRKQTKHSSNDKSCDGSQPCFLFRHAMQGDRGGILRNLCLSFWCLKEHRISPSEWKSEVQKTEEPQDQGCFWGELWGVSRRKKWRRVVGGCLHFLSLGTHISHTSSPEPWDRPLKTVRLSFMWLPWSLCSERGLPLPRVPWPDSPRTGEQARSGG